MVVAAALLIGILVGAGLAWYFMRETTSVAADIIAGYREDLGSALDRIQAPDLETFKVATRPEPDPGPEPEYWYDPTGLVELEADPRDSE